MPSRGEPEGVTVDKPKKKRRRGRAEREKDSRLLRSLFHDDQRCAKCGIVTDPNGVFRTRPRLVEWQGAKVLVCRQCHDELK